MHMHTAQVLAVHLQKFRDTQSRLGEYEVKHFLGLLKVAVVKHRLSAVADAQSQQ